MSIKFFNTLYLTYVSQHLAAQGVLRLVSEVIGERILCSDSAFYFSFTLVSVLVYLIVTYFILALQVKVVVNNAFYFFVLELSIFFVLYIFWLFPIKI